MKTTTGRGTDIRNPSKVAIFRHSLLPLSNTFILNQAKAMTTWQPMFIGLKREPGLDISKFENHTAEDDLGILGGLGVAFGKITGRYPLLESWIIDRKPSIIHAHFGNEAQWSVPIAKRLGLPLVATFHGMDAACLEHIHRGGSTSEVHPAIRRFYPKRLALAKAASRIIAVSNFIKGLLISVGFPEEKIETSHIGIDIPLWAEAHSDPAIQHPYMLFIGRLVEKKGILDLLAAWKIAKPGCDLRIVGGGPLAANIQASIEGASDIHMHGPTPPEQVRSLMKGAMACIVPSRRAPNGDCEGLPTVIYEALAASTPIIASKHAGIPEAIDDGIEGLLFPEGDVSELAKSIAVLSRNTELAHRLGRAGLERASKNFNIHDRIRQVENIYHQCIAVGQP
jgi:glycosyltransferase involved in cell wall biosynthesis